MPNSLDDWKEMYDVPDESEIYQGPVLFYNETVMDHFSNPRNVGEMEAEEADGYSKTGDPACGDVMLLWIKVEADRIVDIKFKSFGCPGAIATSSMMTILARGKTLDEAKRLTDDDIIVALKGIPERKKHCSLLGVTALQNAINDYQQKIINTKKKIDK